jgi:predicted nucleic acid-binding protein
MKEVLDTRFLTEYFYSNDPQTKMKTTRKLKELKAKNEGVLPTITLTEIVQITCDIRGKDLAESRYQSLLQSGLQIQTLTPQIGLRAGLLKSKYKNVPIGDCIIAATAIENHARVLSNDPHFNDIEETRCIWINT